MRRKVKLSFYRKTAIALAFILMTEAIFPALSFALTGGPSQPEVQSFEPVNTSETVDLFTGDFNYNIPLLDVGGYPINISYHSGPSTDEESSWVGLGWNINPGVINRNMRGLPDDFNGEKIIKEMHVKDNHTFGMTFLASPEAFGKEVKLPGLELNFGLGISYNNYNGVGVDVIVNPSLSVGGANDSKMTLGVGLTASAESGVDIKPSLSFSDRCGKYDNKEGVLSMTTSSLSIGLAFNSRAGLKDLTLSGSKDTREGKVPYGEQLKQDAPTTESHNGGASISFATPSYTPYAEMNMNNYGLSLAATLGAEFIGLHANAKISGYYSGQFLVDGFRTPSSYGYLYAHKATVGGDVLLDFNREKDGTYNKYTPNLPLTNFTFDVYSVSGQGIGGVYRPFRSEVGTVFDPDQSNMGGNLDIPGIEIGMGNAAHGGVNVAASATYTTSGIWRDAQGFNGNVHFKENTSDPFYEPVYFKQAGEKTAETDPDFINSIGGTEAVRVFLQKDQPNAYAKKRLVRKWSGPIDFENLMRKKRQRRNQTVSVLTTEEASEAALIREVESYQYNSFAMDDQGKYAADIFPRLQYYPKHHISEVTALRPDGARYVYGIPAYNTTQQEVSFAINGNSPDCNTGLVNYKHGLDNTADNQSGRDHFYSKTTLPSYAHSYLLTSILSPDYVDLGTSVPQGVNGPSDDDLGSYTRVNYTRVSPNYKWRVPYTGANYNEGLKSLRNSEEKVSDDRASYIYGEKELWYIHSIETKTHIAEFTLEDRADGKGAAGDQGGMDASSSMKRLKFIQLFSKEDKRKNGTNAIPIKTVYFVYDYSISAGVPNSTAGGKLALKEIYFTYGKSGKGRLNSYKFNYGYNPAYNLKAYDRWGNYMPNNAVTDCENINGPLTTSEFPYVNQDRVPLNHPDNPEQDPEKRWPDVYSAAWSISSIELPSGGIVKINYEADDYAYVQDKQAMRMFKITGSSTSAPYTGIDPEKDSRLMSSTLQGSAPFNYLFFKLDKPINNESGSVNPAQAAALIKKYYIGDITQLYYKFLVKVSGFGQDDMYEYVPGFAEIDGYGVVPSSGDYSYGYVKLKNTAFNDREDKDDGVNPISKQAWIFTRLHLPKVATRQPDPVSNSDDGAKVVLDVLESLAAAFGSLGEFIQGPNRHMCSQDYGKQFIRNKSWVRLYNPNGKKKGGGHRVKKITLSDEWKQMTGAAQVELETSEYGQEYDYTTVNEYGDTISSGVAAYEPMLGGEENPFRQPIFIREEKLLAPDDRYYQEEPFGESFFPAPSVGYSRVTVRNIRHDQVTRNATGKVVHEFYTAKDFPTLADRTDVDPASHSPKPYLKPLKIRNREYKTVAQGFVVEVNDMHGKPRSQMVYPEGADKPLSGVKYYYKSKAYNGKDRETLNNEVQVINPDGTISTAQIGIDYDVVADSRESERTTGSGGLRGNVDAFFAFMGFVIPVPLPALSFEQTRFRSLVMTKVVNRYGLLDRVEAFDMGSSVETRNLLYDAETGEVLLTQTSNAFKDPVYTFTYPAHWAYNGMGSAYRNIGLTFRNSALSSISSAAAYFVPGDELLLLPSSGNAVKAWVTEVHDNGLSAQDISGTPVQENTSWSMIKIVRSGRRNQQTTPIGSVTTLYNPLVNFNGNYSLNFAAVLQAGAVEFEQNWRTYCECTMTSNPYIAGTVGNWRVKKSYTYLTDRIQDKKNNNLNTRSDGKFQAFTPFWTLKNGAWLRDNDRWTWAAEITRYNPDGMELENKDALNRYSAAVYGYGNMLPKGVAGNSQYKEVGVDDFEDYDYINCTNDHFSYKRDHASKVVSTQSHTGKKSIKVTPNSVVSVTKQLDEKCNVSGSSAPSQP